MANTNYTRNVKAYFVVGFFILFTSALASYKITTLLIETSSWVSHTHQVETLLESIVSQLTDAETGQRGFILTNKTEYLVPYEQVSRVYLLSYKQPKA